MDLSVRARGQAARPRYSGPVLAVDNLQVAYTHPSGTTRVLRRVSLEIDAGEAVGLVGERGCGKSTLACAVMRSLGGAGRVTGGQILFQGQNLLALSDAAWRGIRGRRMTMVAQDPQSALNPSLVIGTQLAEVFRVHRRMDKAAAWAAAERMLEQVQIADAAAVLRRYPHQLSGGLRQRVGLALALATDPDLLILDEPTTGLDVTGEAAVLELVADLRRAFHAAILLISHNLGVIARVCDRVGVLYAGEVVEQGTVADIVRAPRHPYTVELLEALPRLGRHRSGSPAPQAVPPGCTFAPRCPLARPACSEGHPGLEVVSATQLSRCFFWHEVRRPDEAPSAGIDVYKQFLATRQVEAADHALPAHPLLLRERRVGSEQLSTPDLVAHARGTYVLRSAILQRPAWLRRLPVPSLALILTLLPLRAPFTGRWTKVHPRAHTVTAVGAPTDMVIDRYQRRHAARRKVILLAVAGLACVETIVASTASAPLGFIAVALLAVAGASALYLALRRPVVLVYIIIGWVALEKIIEPHLPLDYTRVDAFSDYVLIAILLWTLLLNLLRRREPLFTMRQIGAPLVAFVALGIVSSAINGVPLHVAGLGLLSTTHTMIIFLVLVNIGIEERHIYRFVSLFFIFMVVSDIVGVLQFTPSSPAWKLAATPPGTADAGFVRVNGLFEWPLALGNYTAIAMPLGLLPLFFEEIRGHKRALLLCAALIMVAAVLLAGSRESWGALLVATLFLGLTVERRLLRVLVQGILPGLLVGALVFQPFLRRLEQVGNGGGRLDFLAASLPVIRSHPWLGVGPGRFGGHVALITHSPLYAQYDLTEVFSRQMTQQIDMFWTHLLAESGVLGTAAYVAAIAACFLAGRRAYREAVTPRQKALLLGLLYAIPVSVVVSFVASFLEATNSATVFWSLMGMLSVMAACPEREPQVQGREHD